MTTNEPELSFLDGLLAATEPKAETIEVIVAKGFSFTFRAITDYTEMVNLRKETAVFQSRWSSTRKVEDYKPYAKTDPDIVALAYFMDKVQISEPKIGLVGFLKIAKDRANVFDAIKDGLNEGQYALANAENEAIEEAKNE